MRKILATMMALALTIGAQGQQDDGLDAMMSHINNFYFKNNHIL